MSEFDKVYAIDEESKRKFWSKVSPNIKKVTKDAGYEPTLFLNWSDDTQTWFMKEEDLMCWFKIVYPMSVIQTEKAMYESQRLCQYRVKIFLTPEQIQPTIIEGPVILCNEENFFTGVQNFVATARTMAISNALRHCGFGCQVNDEYFVTNNTQQNIQPVNQQKNVQAVLQNKSFIEEEIDIDEAANCRISYFPTCKKNKMYNGRPLGEVAKIAPKFIERILNENNFCDEYTVACAKTLMRAARS